MSENQMSDLLGLWLGVMGSVRPWHLPCLMLDEGLGLCILSRTNRVCQSQRRAVGWLETSRRCSYHPCLLEEQDA